MKKESIDNNILAHTSWNCKYHIVFAAQDMAYGEGLDKDIRHPYMWLCKGHYYSGSFSFYNYPYAFGGLFARSLIFIKASRRLAFLMKLLFFLIWIYPLFARRY